MKASTFLQNTNSNFNKQFKNKKNDLGLFILKFITYYFLYGYLCLIGIAGLIILSIVLYNNISFPYNLSFLIPTILILPILGQFIKIVFSTSYKYRYFKISLYRLRTRGYKPEYFECEIQEPCLRLIIKDILYSFGFKKEYKELCNSCKGKDMRIENAKQKLLAKVEKKYRESSTI